MFDCLLPLTDLGVKETLGYANRKKQAPRPQGLLGHPSHCWDKMPWQRQLKKGYILAHGLSEHHHGGDHMVAET